MSRADEPHFCELRADGTCGLCRRALEHPVHIGLACEEGEDVAVRTEA